MKAYAVAIALLFPAAALASPEFCVEAKKSGNKERWDFWATQVLGATHDLTPRQITAGKACLKDFPGGPYVYVDGKFINADQAEREAEAERQAQINAEAAEAAATEFRLAAEAEKSARQFRVIQQLQDSCIAMFRRDPDATITNKLCFDVLMESGLPD